MGRQLAASSGPNAENTLISLSLFSVTALGLLGQLERRPSSPAGADSVPWATLLAWTGAVLSATPILLPAAGHVTHGHLAAVAFPAITMHLSMSRHLGADVQADVQAHFPAILHTLLQSAGRLAMPGEAALGFEQCMQMPYGAAFDPKQQYGIDHLIKHVRLIHPACTGLNARGPHIWRPLRPFTPPYAGQPLFHPGGWMGVISCAGIIVNAKEYDAATNAALATAGPGSTPGRKLAALLLDFLCCLADMGLPSNFAAAPQAAPQAAPGPAALDGEFYLDRQSALLCWQQLMLVGAGPAFAPFLSAELARHGRSARLMTTLPGLLEQLHEQEQQRRQQQWQSQPNACPLLPSPVDIRLSVASVASSFIGEVVSTYGKVLGGLLAPAQAAGQGQSPAPWQGSLLQAAQKGLSYAWHAVRALPQAAAVYTAADWTAGWETDEDMVHAHQAALAFNKLAQSAGEGG